MASSCSQHKQYQRGFTFEGDPCRSKIFDVSDPHFGAALDSENAVVRVKAAECSSARNMPTD